MPPEEIRVPPGEEDMNEHTLWHYRIVYQTQIAVCAIGGLVILDLHITRGYT
jgi:hypothetical protein